VDDAVFLLAVAAVIVVLSAASVRVLREDERLLVLRLGREVGVVGPGCVFLLPIVDKGIRVNLTERVVGWRGIPKTELDRRVIEIALRDARSM
jgi:regulator of protease activity HflC (stomatin/prohibitin superfamily)